MAVDVATRGAGVFKHLLLVLAVLQQLGHHGTHLGVSLHVVEQRIEPPLRSAHVAVEQHRVGIHRGVDGLVVASRKTVVLVKREDLYVGELVAQHVQAVVVAPIVGHNDVGHSGIGARDDRGQITAQQLRAVPVEDDYCDLFHCFFRVASTLMSSWMVVPNSTSTRRLTNSSLRSRLTRI